MKYLLTGAPQAIKDMHSKLRRRAWGYVVGSLFFVEAALFVYFSGADSGLGAALAASVVPALIAAFCVGRALQHFNQSSTLLNMHLISLTAQRASSER